MNKLNYLFTCLLLAVSNLSCAAEILSLKHTPLYVSSELPIVIGLGLPITLPAQLEKANSLNVNLNIDVKSNANNETSFNKKINAEETLAVFGETKSLELGLAYGLNEQWQIDLQTSYIKHSGGSLDGFIRDWHEFFGLPEGDRPLFEEGGFKMSYQTSAKTKQVKPSQGLGDIRLGLAYAISQAHIDDFTLRLGVNLPTGNAEKLTGSDKADVDVGLYSSGQSIAGSNDYGWHANLGFIYVGDKTSLGVSTKDIVAFNSVGLSWKATPTIQLKAQLDSHGSFFESAIEDISRSTAQLSLGAVYKTEKSGQFELYFSEDLAVNRSADFAIGLTSRFSF